MVFIVEGIVFQAVEGLAAVYLARTKFLFSRRNCLGWFLLSLVAGRAAHREVFFFPARRGPPTPRSVSAQVAGYPVAQAMLELKQARSRAFMAAYRRKRD